ncbi:hypothetical protein [Leptospira mayottensis]|uniref:Uncharacterized protein n=2 Tax=Leptospira mayottensis TaxID=1137606 RepID=A0AA87SUR8_9LEPT|nr:hypothetical protein [Leptospira mayottensis]AXR66578.1 hypothetical protein DQM28_20455 [Leptospira mayottensis]AZQ04214.1 hypothetical protein LEP1GSC190_19370 [Leptospira mayottensis 200901116]EKR98065.1 hypothetical protein LEP1GSC125_1569 [Leptospira mayottensis 200901122]TGN04307.1 hypothetical protein EHR03_10710 [Leptospira mayottensis]
MKQVCKNSLKEILVQIREKLKLLFVFPIYLFGMIRLAVTIYYQKLMLQTQNPGQVMLLYYDPRTINTLNIVEKLERLVVKPFRQIHKINPIVLVLPYGNNLQTGSIKAFYSSLDRDQKREFKKVIYEDKEIITPKDIL